MTAPTITTTRRMIIADSIEIINDEIHVLYGVMDDLNKCREDKAKHEAALSILDATLANIINDLDDLERIDHANIKAVS